MALSKGYGQTVSNLNVFGSFPCWMAFRAVFISSHYALMGDGCGVPNVEAPIGRYVLVDATEYGWLWGIC